MFQSRATRRFWKSFAELPVEVREQAQRSYRTFQNNPFHPGLQFKSLRRKFDLLRANRSWSRAVGAVKGNRVVWFWIGNHADFDRMFQS